MRASEVFFVIGLALVYVPGLLELSQVWRHVDYYSHGFLVPVVAWWAGSRLTPRLRRAPQERDSRGLLVVIASLAVYAWGILSGSVFATGLAMVAAVAGALLYLRGAAWLSVLVFPVAYLVFMVPLPDAWVAPVIVKLQLIVSGVAFDLVRFGGMSILREGNVITLPGGDSVFVAEACSGITSIITLLPLGVFLAYFTERTLARRAALVAAVFPLAMLGNLLRVVGTLVACQYVGVEAATTGPVHEWARRRDLRTGMPRAARRRCADAALLARARRGSSYMSGAPRDRSAPRAAGSGVSAVAAERVLLGGLTLALLAAGVVSWVSYLRPALEVKPESLSEVPLEIGVWRGRDIPVAGDVERMLDADFNVQRAYFHPVGDFVWFYVGYYGTERGGKPEHTPWVCYPSNGWSILSSREVTLGTSGESRANELLIEKQGDHRLVHFWYQSHRRTGMLGRFDQAVDHFLGRLRDGRADGSLVRISTPIDGVGDVAAARARLAAFGRQLMPELRLHWPAEGVDGTLPAG